MLKHGERTAKGVNVHNQSGFTVVGNRLLLAPEGGEKVTEGGIVIPDNVVDKREAQNVWATVVEIGLDCWADRGTDFCEVGDRVLVGKYAGIFQVSPKDGKRYRFLNDLDVIAVERRD